MLKSLKILSKNNFIQVKKNFNQDKQRFLDLKNSKDK